MIKNDHAAKGRSTTYEATADYFVILCQNSLRLQLRSFWQSPNICKNCAISPKGLLRHFFSYLARCFIKKSEKSQKKAAVIFTAVIFLILAVSVACLWYAKTHSKKGTIASLVQSGKVIKTINLDEVTESYTFRVDGDDGISYNIIEVRPGEIGVIEASCPDKICISMGFVKEMGLPITCLPNELIIILSDGEGMEPDMVVY